MKRLLEVDNEIKLISDRLAEIESLSDPEGDEVARSEILTRRTTETDDLISRFKALKAEREPLLVRAQALADVAAAAKDLARVESGDGARYLGGVGPNYMKKVDPYEASEMDAIRSGRYESGDIVSRARKAVEVAPRHLNDKGREHLEKLLVHFGDDQDSRQAPLIARHVLMTGSPEYHRQFQEYMRTGFPGDVLRANMSLTDANGGYLVPFTLDPTIILTNAGVVDPIRSIATIKQTATDTASYITSAGATAGWTAESAEATDGNVGVGQITITPKRADSWIAGSYELLADSGFANELSKLLADAKSRLEGAAFATGNTAATRPRGVVSVSAAVTTSIVAAAATNAFAIGDVYSVANALRPRDAAQATWLANKSIFNKIRQFDTSGSAAFWANLGMGRPQQLLGQPVYEVSTMQSAVTTAGLVLLAGNFEQYYIVDRIGMSVQYNPMVMGRTNSRPTGEAGWLAMWRVGADTVDPDAFRILQLNAVAANVALA